MRVVDTDFIVDLLLGDEGARKKAGELDERSEAATTMINVYEIYGILSRNIYLSDKQTEELLTKFNLLLKRMQILPFDKRAVHETMKLQKSSGPGEHPENELAVMIGGTVLANSCDTIISKKNRFVEIKGIRTEKY